MRFFGAVFLAIALFVGCTPSNSSGTVQTSSDDAGGTECSTEWNVVDFEHECIGPVVSVNGICQTPAVTRVKGLQDVCVVDSAGQLFLGARADDFRYSGEGWSFGPVPLANGELVGTPSLSPADDSRCRQAIVFGGIGVPSKRACSAEDGGATGQDAGASE